MSCRVAGLSLALIGSLLVIVTSADNSQANVMTVGSPQPISASENVWIVCDSCVLTNPTAPGGGDVSPVDGLILRWRLYSGVTDNQWEHPQYRLRVLSPFGSGYLGGGASAIVVPKSWGVVETFPAHLPIKAGQLVALELVGQDSGIRFGFSSSARSVFLEPAISEGETGTPSTVWENGFIFPFNADVLPPPRIVGISPTGGSFMETTEVTVTGDNFAEVESVTFGTEKVSFRIDSETMLTAVVPPGPALSSVPVKVATAAGSVVAAGAYAYEGCVVPKLKERLLRTARRMLSGAKCSLGQVRLRHQATAKSGRVKRQRPHAGAVLAPGSTVEVALGMDLVHVHH
jgi:hypothetical protein